MKEYTFENFISDECNRDHEFKKLWDADEEDRKLIISMIRARKAMNLSQAQLSKITGINQSKISKIETGKANPTFKMLKKIGKALNTSLIFESNAKVKMQVQ